MSEYREKIWAMAPYIGEYLGDPSVNPEDHRFTQEYIRADLHEALQARVAELEGALRDIADWKMPESKRTMPNGAPMSYSAAYGSHGERLAIISMARAALNDTDGETG